MEIKSCAAKQQKGPRLGLVAGVSSRYWVQLGCVCVMAAILVLIRTAMPGFELSYSELLNMRSFFM